MMERFFKLNIRYGTGLLEKKTSKRGQTHGKILWNKDWNEEGGNLNFPETIDITTN
jgi:hypothetical protein